MNKFLTLTEAQRRTVFEQTAIRIKLPVASERFLGDRDTQHSFLAAIRRQDGVQGWYIAQ